MNGMLRLILVLTLITAGAGLILSLVETVTREPIAEQRRLATLRALKAVLPPADNDSTSLMADSTLLMDAVIHPRVMS